jgi:hypothetical protein
VGWHDRAPDRMADLLGLSASGCHSIISSPQAITATRLGLMLVNLLGSIDADKISKALAAGSKEPPSLLAIGKQATSPLEKSKAAKHE